MFTGIVETTGVVETLEADGTNRILSVSSSLWQDLKRDQSLSHDGVCLTVTGTGQGVHHADIIGETLRRSHLGGLRPGQRLNLERSLPFNGRLDGHLVQGHIDTISTCLERRKTGESWIFRFGYPEEFGGLLVEKGSVCLNGISLTVFDLGRSAFSVAVIPYTFGHTNMEEMEEGQSANIEFDLIGKYIFRLVHLGIPALPQGL